jgi:hypothetical protein
LIVEIFQIVRSEPMPAEGDHVAEASTNACSLKNIYFKDVIDSSYIIQREITKLFL